MPFLQVIVKNLEVQLILSLLKKLQSLYLFAMLMIFQFLCLLIPLGPHTFETSSLGAAIASAVGIGLYPDFSSAVDKMTHLGKRFDPIDANQKIYNDLYHKVYKKMYGNLKPSYEAIWSITNRVSISA